MALCWPTTSIRGRVAAISSWSPTEWVLTSPGELASKLAVEGVSHLYHKYVELSAPEALQKAMLETNAKVHQRGQANADFRNMGTTASALILLPQGAFVAHIGDSRVYRLRESPAGTADFRSQPGVGTPCGRAIERRLRVVPFHSQKRHHAVAGTQLVGAGRH